MIQVEASYIKNLKAPGIPGGFCFTLCLHVAASAAQGKDVKYDLIQIYSPATFQHYNVSTYQHNPIP
jgi:hypothetical protein